MSSLFDALREAFFMFWETLWALILGFTLSGAVQAFVSKQRMQRVMGDHRPASVARASGFGMVSSSCSYAATAMAKSLFQKGADFTTAMIFMFASTNLVVELGLVLLVLMGWQFALAEFVGGPIMIVLLALVGGFVFTPKLVRAARARSQSEAAEHDHGGSMGSRAGWSDAARYTLADIRMLKRELVIGYLVAGFLTVYVSMECWNRVFLQGHGFWTTLENVIVGPFIACISFVCSIGNVPMAAALWHGGISFGGVISFIFADLITLPLLLIYRKYYGTALTVRIFFTFWALMSTAGLAVEGIFALFGAIPTVATRGGRSRTASSGTTRRSSTSSSSVSSACSSGCRAATPGVKCTRPTRCAECRSRRRPRLRTSCTTASMSGSAPTAAGSGTSQITTWTRRRLASLLAR